MLPQLVFEDESKFAINKLVRARKVGPRGVERVGIEYRANEKRLNMRLMTTLAINDNPISFQLREENVMRMPSWHLFRARFNRGAFHKAPSLCGTTHTAATGEKGQNVAARSLEIVQASLQREN